MIKITVIAMGKLKEKYFIAAAEEYLKRLSRYADIKVFDPEPERLAENATAAEIDTALKKEAEKINRHIPKGALKIALCIEGTQKSSEEFSRLLCENVNAGRPLCFIIGSSHGLDSGLKAAADLKLSVSKMTFPHKLFRVMLLEQIYRAFKISEGGNYHK